MRVVLAAGGTGGHIEPALNLADALQRRSPDIAITVIGSERGLERTLVPARGYDLVTLRSLPLPRRLGRDLMLWAPRLRSVVAEATDLLATPRTDVVVGFGGYAAAPTYLAARRKSVPLIIHESNARAGVANRLGARLTRHVYAAYAGSLPRAKVLAPPLRRAIATVDRSGLQQRARETFGLAIDKPTLLVFGGSQGARSLNVALMAALPELVGAGLQVLHSYGSRNDAPDARHGYVPVPFIEHMDLAYAAADLALTRAGAMTCAELAAVGLPGVYVPLPIGNGEQRLNALPVVNAGGGILLDDAALSAEWLTQTVTGLLHDNQRLRSMSEAAYRHGVRDADEQLARIVLRVGGTA